MPARTCRCGRRLRRRFGKIPVVCWQCRKIKHVVHFSGGLCSWYTAKVVAKEWGAYNLVLLFADTLVEDEDLYRFLYQAAKDVGVKLTRICDGRTPLQVFKDEKFLGNSRVDPCSKRLKRELLARWISENCKIENTVQYAGLNWDESDRFERWKKRMQPWVVRAPLTEDAYLPPLNLAIEASKCGLNVPRLYAWGFPHNNCGGACIKAGQAQWKLLLERKPDYYRYWEEGEQEVREHIGKDVSILRIQRDGVKHNVTLRQFREWIESGYEGDPYDWGGCGCAIDADDSVHSTGQDPNTLPANTP